MSGSIEVQLEEMHKRVTQHEILGSALDRELTEKRQRQIVESASGVLFEKGYHRTSIRDIAAACGMSMGQLYHYISSKDDILYLIHVYSQEIWYEHLRDAGFQSITDPVARLARALRLSLEFIEGHRQLYLFLYTESKHLEREHLKLVLELDDKNVVGFYRHLLADIPGLELDAARRDTAANLVAFIVVFLALRGWNLDTSRISAQVDFLMEFVFRGLGLQLPPASER
ncbi:MAG: TetR/AcrR family transcriptional regulator [Thermoleophilia bacterium]|nr:TetR/AcrR family transcriptional regulator [Thermoleophilia bacterium]